jgi:hypothetical protein
VRRSGSCMPHLHSRRLERESKGELWAAAKPPVVDVQACSIQPQQKQKRQATKGATIDDAGCSFPPPVLCGLM